MHRARCGQEEKRFNDVTQLVENLLEFDNEYIVIDYFQQVEADILLEKELKQHELDIYYQKLVDAVHERKVKCLQNLNTNKQLESELEAIKQMFIIYASKLKTDNVDFILKTLDGDEDKWKAIQSECNTMLRRAKSLDVERQEKLVNDQMIEFVPRKTLVEQMRGHLGVRTIYSAILSSYKMETDLVKLCQLSGKQFRLLYRASRHGFAASSFQDKCDHQANTLTVIKTTKGFVFGGYAAVAWDSESG